MKILAAVTACFVASLVWPSVVKSDDQSGLVAGLPTCVEEYSVHGVSLSQLRSEGSGMILANLIDSSSFPAGWYSGLSSSGLGWMHILSDSAMCGAYFTISVVLLYLLIRRRDLAFPKLLWLFAAFILASGIGHLVEAGNFWWPAYRVSGVVKLTTAVISWATVLVLIRLIPETMKLPSLTRLAKEQHHSEKRMEFALEAGTIGVWEWNLKTDKLTWDRRTRDFFDIVENDSELSYESFISRIHAGDRDRVNSLVRESIETKQPYEAELCVVYRDGSVHYVRARGSTVDGDDGEPETFVGVCLDITEQKEQECEIRESAAKIESVLNTAADGIITINERGIIQSANPAAVRIFGYTAEELHGQNVSMLMPSPYEEQHDAYLARYQETRKPKIIGNTRELTARRKDGTVFPMELSVSEVSLKQQSLFTGFVRDITKRKRDEEELRLAKSQAEEANRTKSEFLANMSHEIRTPMTGILGFTDLLLRNIDHGDEEERLEYLQTIHKCGQHLLELINGILDLSKIEAGQMHVELTACPPHQLIADIVSTLRPRAREKGVNLEYRWESKIPEFIQSDSHRMRQLLMNLVGNAIKFTEQGRVTILATLVEEGESSRLRLAVRDSGIGMSPDQLKRIFTPFVQADASTTRKFGGTGLGLAICKNIAELLGGEIAVESQLGRGSVFTVTLPVGDMAGVQLFEHPPAHDSESVVCLDDSAISLQGVRVLLADDGEANRKLIRLFLSRLGADVTTADNGELACKAAFAQRFDIVLMDMQMPVMDGYEASRKLRESGFDGPLLALTANAMRGDRNKCFEAGCSGYISKPVNLDKLVREMQAAIRLLAPIAKTEIQV